MGIGTYSMEHYGDYATFFIWPFIRTEHPEGFALIVAVGQVIHDYVPSKFRYFYNVLRFAFLETFLVSSMIKLGDVADLQVNDIAYFFLVFVYSIYISGVYGNFVLKRDPTTFIKYSTRLLCLSIVVYANVDLFKELASGGERAIPLIKENIRETFNTTL